MKQSPIDFYCFCIDSLDTPYWSDYSVNQNGINFRKDLMSDLAFSQKIGKCLFYVKNDDMFVMNGEPVDIKGKVVFPRCGLPDSFLLLSKIKQMGGKSITTLDDIKKISSWPQYCKPFHHKVFETTKKDFIANFEKYKQELGRVFFKTKRKNFACEVLNIQSMGNAAFIDSEEDLLSANPIVQFLDTKLITTKDRYGNIIGHDNRISNLKDDEKVFVENFIEIELINNIPEEYRCFVLDGKLANISKYFTEENVAVDNECISFANKVIKNLPKDFPKYFVLDICKIKKDGESVFDIVEFNSIESSGYAAGNSIMSMEKQSQNNENFNLFSDNKEIE